MILAAHKPKISLTVLKSTWLLGKLQLILYRLLLYHLVIQWDEEQRALWGQIFWGKDDQHKSPNTRFNLFVRAADRPHIVFTKST